jgi:hypothetical protein
MSVENKDMKSVLIQNIKDWIRLDTEISKMKAEINKKNKEKKQLTTNLIEVMKTHQMKEFDISGGKLQYKETKVKKQLNGKYLLKTLEKYYENNKSTATEITNYILENREIAIKETIKRKIAT